MTHIVDEGIGLLQAAGHKVQDGASAAGHKMQQGAGAVQKQAKKQTQKRKKSGRQTHLIELAGSIAGAVAAFFVSRLVRSQLGRRGR